ncbi:MAG: DNA polymerase I [Gammaproteobacteria bacterium]|nr:DNA polymerase I [Gammaproteobacteria bacterium]MDE2022931.1 DNA polymerase I [Gammaproteobacteria bacterium]
MPENAAANDTSKKLLILVDGSSYLYRAFYALPPLSNSKGEPTGAVRGVAAMLKKLLADYAPEHVAVVFDASGKTFRDELFAEYKANRPSMPDDMSVQIEPLHALVKALGFPVLQIPGVEADDVIGTLAKQAADDQLPVLISTGDKDMGQLVNSQVTLVNTMTGTVLDREGVKQKFGVWPEQMIDYLALVGDSSDNIPGVSGIGPKTAAPLLEHFGTLESLYARLDEVPQLAVRGAKQLPEKLRAQKEQALLSRRLAVIRCDVELPVKPTDLKMRAPDAAALRELYARLEFKTWLRELDGGDTKPMEAAPASVAAASSPLTPHASPEPSYATILDESALDKWLARLEAAELFAFDTETTSLDYMQARIVGLSFAVKAGEAAYLPLTHHYADAPTQLDRKQTLQRLKPLLESAVHKKLGHHIKYDAHVLANHGIALAGIQYDSMLESYVLDSVASQHNMDALAEKYLDYKTIHYEDVAGKGAKQIGFDQVRIEDATRYAAEDADVTLRLHQTLWPRLRAVPALKRVFEDIEMPLVPVLFAMEQNGVLLDSAMLRRQSSEITASLRKLELRAHELAGQPFNLDSPKQLQSVLFEKMQLPVARKTPGGQPSTAEDVLEELAAGYELPKVIVDYRALSKLKSTYTDTLPAQVDPGTGRVHTSYHQAVAATGRLSSMDPNLQNIPVRTAEGRRIRQAFIAPPGSCIMSADYSQIELRIMAHLSGDAGLMAAFEQGMDIHRATAAEVFGLKPEEVSDERRRAAKAINFGLIYGMSAFGLAKQLGIERSAAQDYVDLYFARYPGVKQFMDKTRALAREQGYVETVFGRRLYLPDIRAKNPQRRQYAERSAINAPMQGTAADIIKRAMIAVHRWLDEQRVPAKMIMQVHDELVFEVKDSALDAVQREVPRLMSGAAKLKVPLVVDAGAGANWDEAH